MSISYATQHLSPALDTPRFLRMLPAATRNSQLQFIVSPDMCEVTGDLQRKLACSSSASMVRRARQPCPGC